MESKYIRFDCANTFTKRYLPGTEAYRKMGSFRVYKPAGTHGRISQTISGPKKRNATNYMQQGGPGTQYFKKPRGPALTKIMSSKIPRSGSIMRIVGTGGEEKDGGGDLQGFHPTVNDMNDRREATPKVPPPTTNAPPIVSKTRPETNIVDPTFEVFDKNPSYVNNPLSMDTQTDYIPHRVIDTQTDDIPHMSRESQTNAIPTQTSVETQTNQEVIEKLFETHSIKTQTDLANYPLIKVPTSSVGVQTLAQDVERASMIRKHTRKAKTKDISSLLKLLGPRKIFNDNRTQITNNNDNRTQVTNNNDNRTQTVNNDNSLNQAQQINNTQYETNQLQQINNTQNQVQQINNNETNNTQVNNTQVNNLLAVSYMAIENVNEEEFNDATSKLANTIGSPVEKVQSYIAQTAPYEIAKVDFRPPLLLGAPPNKKKRKNPEEIMLAAVPAWDLPTDKALRSGTNRGRRRVKKD